MKRVLLFSLTLALLLTCVLPLGVSAEEEATPISTVEEFEAMTPTGSYYLTGDIDFGGKVYEESFQHRFLQTPENAEMLDLIHDSIVYDSGRLFADDIAMFNLFRNAYYDTEWRTLYGERYTIWMANIERVTVKLG